MPEKPKNLPAYVERRLNLAALFDTPSQTDKRRWGRLFASDLDAIQKSFSLLAKENGYTQQSGSKDTLLWYEENRSDAECMFCFIQDVSRLENIETIFKHIKTYHPFFTYAIVPQFKDGDGVYDIFRFSRFSFLEHHNRVRAPVKKTKSIE
jgi:hypothetical protein